MGSENRFFNGPDIGRFTFNQEFLLTSELIEEFV